MEKKIVASFKRASQISPDAWDTWLEVKVCRRETTIGEIIDWYKSYGYKQSIGIEITEEK